jgi:hypothetical protein
MKSRIFLEKEVSTYACTLILLYEVFASVNVVSIKLCKYLTLYSFFLVSFGMRMLFLFILDLSIMVS